MPTLKDRLINMMSSKNYDEVHRHRWSLWIQHVDTISNLAVDMKTGYLYSASWDRTERALYTTSADSKIKIWAKAPSARKHSFVTTLHKHKSAINALSLSADGSILYSGGCDRSVIAWKRDITKSVEHIQVSGILRGHMGAILCLGSITDLLCNGSADTTIRVWKKGLSLENNVVAHSCFLILEGHCRPVTAITTSNVGMEYVFCSGSLDHYIKVWWFRDPKLEEEMKVGRSRNP
eukprot:PITA_34850